MRRSKTIMKSVRFTEQEWQQFKELIGTNYRWTFSEICIEALKRMHAQLALQRLPLEETAPVSDPQAPVIPLHPKKEAKTNGRANNPAKDRDGKGANPKLPRRKRTDPGKRKGRVGRRSEKGASGPV